MLGREALLGSFTRRFADVQTCIGTLRIRNLTEAEKSDYQAGSTTADGKSNPNWMKASRRRLCALVLVDEDGNLLLNQAGDVARLADIDSAVTSAVFEAAMKHCGFVREEQDELAKNFDEAIAGDSPTG